jgi:hypothetical protein
MADKIEAKRKLEQLATRVKGKITTYNEDVIIGRAVDAGKIKNRSDLTRELSEALGKSPSEVGTVLASDDSDRLADEIVSLLKE